MRRFLSSAVIAAAILGFIVPASASEAGPYDIDTGIPDPLTETAGDATAGRDVVINRKLGNCLACHAISDLSAQPFHGEIGPSLDGVSERWSEGQLRLILVNSKAVFEGTIMPAFYKEDGHNRPLDNFAGKSIISAQNIEDLIAYLKTLK